MSFEDFQHYTRLYVVGALDADERAAFEEARTRFGSQAEGFIRDCRALNAAFALSLHPKTPRVDSKRKLLGMIRSSRRGQHVTA